MLFEESTVVPEQFFVHARRSTVQGERRLLLAILEEAIECFCKRCGARDSRGMNLFREADRWIFSSDRTQYFAFLNICDVLDLNSSSIRRALLDWKYERLGSLDKQRKSLQSARPAKRAAA